jgi:hypothetical protein
MIVESCLFNANKTDTKANLEMFLPCDAEVVF